MCGKCNKCRLQFYIGKVKNAGILDFKFKCFNLSTSVLSRSITTDITQSAPSIKISISLKMSLLRAKRVNLKFFSVRLLPMVILVISLQGNTWHSLTAQLSIFNPLNSTTLRWDTVEFVLGDCLAVNVHVFN